MRPPVPSARCGCACPASPVLAVVGRGSRMDGWMGDGWMDGRLAAPARPVPPHPASRLDPMCGCSSQCPEGRRTRCLGERWFRAACAAHPSPGPRRGPHHARGPFPFAFPFRLPPSCSALPFVLPSPCCRPLAPATCGLQYQLEATPTCSKISFQTVRNSAGSTSRSKPPLPVPLVHAPDESTCS